MDTETNSLSKVHDTYVPPVGNEDADIMLVGEAPGKNEARQREPFVGKSGSVLNDYLAKLGIRRPDDAFWTNLCRYRPAGNKFQNARGTHELEMGIEELKEEIKQVDPNVIVALGSWPLWYLTGKKGKRPGTGILSWRGSQLPCTLVEGYKVIPTLHPAFLLRVWRQHPIFYEDLRYAAFHADFPEILEPEYETFLAGDNPDHEDWIGDGRLEELADEMAASEWLEVDIETFSDNTMSCCGFADRHDRTLVVTFQRSGWRRIIERLLQSDARKILQFGTYDRNFLKRFYSFDLDEYTMTYDEWDEGPVEIRNVGWDTYIAAATLMPEFDRGLDFLASVYTDFPYYKEDRKSWQEGKVDLGQLWAYNAKDNIAEFIVAARQMRELAEMWDFDVPSPFPELPDDSYARMG